MYISLIHCHHVITTWPYYRVKIWLLLINFTCEHLFMQRELKSEDSSLTYMLCLFFFFFWSSTCLKGLLDVCGRLNPVWTVTVQPPVGKVAVKHTNTLQTYTQSLNHTTICINIRYDLGSQKRLTSRLETDVPHWQVLFKVHEHAHGVHGATGHRCIMEQILNRSNELHRGSAGSHISTWRTAMKTWIFMRTTNLTATILLQSHVSASWEKWNITTSSAALWPLSATSDPKGSRLKAPPSPSGHHQQGLNTTFPLWLLGMQRNSSRSPLDLNKWAELIVSTPPAPSLWIHGAEIMTGSSEQNATFETVLMFYGHWWRQR